MHWMLNVVTGAEGVPAAVLIRGVVGQAGPGRLTRALGIGREFNGRRAARSAGLWFEPGMPVSGRLIERTPRTYAGDWAAKPLRFVVDPGRLAMVEGVAARAGRQPRRTGQ